MSGLLRSSRSRAMCASVAAFLVSACGGPEPRTSVLTIDATTPADEPIDVLELAWSGGFAAEPLGATPRPVEVLEVLAVDTLRLKTDRGEEVVRLHGLTADDERLPDDVRAVIRGEYREAMEAWLTAPGTEVFEVGLEAYGDRGAAAGPSYLGFDGRRLVSLQRVRADEGTGPADLLETALERGWGVSAHSFEDHLALEPRLVFRGDPSLADELESAVAARFELASETARIDAMTEDELQLLGETVLAEVADWLGWEPRAEMRFEKVTREEMELVLNDFVPRGRAALREWVNGLAERIRAEATAAGRDVTTAVTIDEPPLEEVVAEKLESLHGYSPGGETIFVLPKGELSHRMLVAVLVHEVMHQYQEELAGADRFYPPPMTPIELGEAHAEYLSARFRVDRHDGYERMTATAYHDSAQHFAGIVEATGLSPDEVYRKYLDEEWERELWDELRDFEIGLQEFLFRQLAQTRYGGLDFRAVSGTGLSEEDGPVVEVENVSSGTFRGQFHGIWIWNLGDEREGTVTLAGAPFNLVLPAGAKVEVRISSTPSWAEYPPAEVTGLFSVTP